MKKSTVLTFAALAAMSPVFLTDTSASASDSGTDVAEVSDATVDTSGTHGYVVVTKVTPSIREQFPELGEVAEQIPPEQLQQGGPMVDALTGEAAPGTPVDE